MVALINRANHVAVINGTAQLSVIQIPDWPWPTMMLNSAAAIANLSLTAVGALFPLFLLGLVLYRRWLPRSCWIVVFG